MTAQRRTNVVIVGGGPAGLILAIELGRRGVACVLLEEDERPPQFPKANATTSRTMEHYRRLGFAAEIRALGLPQDYPQDITYFTRYSSYELARLRGRSRREAAEARESAASRWPTPEPLHRVQQMLIEAVLKEQAEKWPAATLRFGWRAVSLDQRTDGISVDAEQVATGAVERIDARYAVGCDGPRSLVREALGIRYEGLAGEERDFMGGRMLAVYLRAPALYSIVRGERSWQYWAVNRERRGLVIAIDGRELFVLHLQLPRGQPGSREYARESLALTAGCEFPFEIRDVAEWTAGYTLVAERFAGGRVLLAGDAAHLFTPTGGQGYNTSVDDASNLGWKLAAVCQGWGSPALLPSYEAERKPIAHRNTGFARAMAESIGRIPIPAAVEDASADGERARALTSERGCSIIAGASSTSRASTSARSDNHTAHPGEEWESLALRQARGAENSHRLIRTCRQRLVRLAPGTVHAPRVCQHHGHLPGGLAAGCDSSPCRKDRALNRV